MYHPHVCEAMLERAVNFLRKEYPGFYEDPWPQRFPLEYRIEITAHLDTLWDAKKLEPVRDLTGEEQLFILSERLLCKFDFRYWLEGYGHCYSDDMHGSITRVNLWGSQELFLDAFAEAQVDMWERFIDGEQAFDGLCFFVHKARQLGFTMITQFIAVHLLNFWGAMRGLTASTNDEKTQAIYLDRFKVSFMAQPWWMRCNILEDVKDRGMKMGNASRMMLQDATQKAGLAQGSQVDFSHLTECASWPDPAMQIQNHFFPTIPRSLRAVCILESTAQGVSIGGPIWWKRSVELAMARRMSRFRCIFVPWYAEPKKYRAYPDTSWTPSEASLRHAHVVESTSPTWMKRKVTLDREQLYWYEREFEAARISGTLNLFLANYCATPEESFQHSGTSAFSHDVLEIQQAATSEPVTYEPLTAETEPERIYKSPKPNSPKPFRIGRSTMVPVKLTDLDPIDDPRGLTLLWEPPTKEDLYFIGVDTASGLPNWSRRWRREDDDRHDNAVISVWRHTPQMDYQVAEYTAPVSESELAYMVYALGHIFAGRDDSGEAPVIIEVVPKGLACQQRLAYDWGYSNLYEWVTIKDGINATASGQFGWQSNRRSMQALWAHGRYHINAGRVRCRSRWLVNELRTCIDDPVKARAAALSGFHDDRVISALLALWFANGWDMYALPDESAYHEPPPDRSVVFGSDHGRTWQETAVGSDEIGELWDELYEGDSELYSY